MNDNITEINKDTFWKLIQSAKETCGQDMDAMMDFLKDRLVSMGPEQAQNFHDILHAYEDLADKFGLWDAAGVMKEYGCSDDGFIDFRAWLIAQGRDTYLSALADPDSLAEVIPYEDCCFETLSYVGDYAYEQLTGKSAYDQTDIDDHLVYLLFLLRQNTVDHITVELAVLVQLPHFLRLRQRGRGLLPLNGNGDIFLMLRTDE